MSTPSPALPEHLSPVHLEIARLLAVVLRRIRSGRLQSAAKACEAASRLLEEEVDRAGAIDERTHALVIAIATLGIARERDLRDIARIPRAA